jgi:hypothetical protein
VGIRKPQDSQQADNEHLSNDRKTVNEEGTQAASNGCFNQIQHVHTLRYGSRFAPASLMTASHAPGAGHPKLPTASLRPLFSLRLVFAYASQNKLTTFLQRFARKDWT